MSQEVEQENAEIRYQNNQAFQQANILQLRLSCDSILERMEFYLRGFRMTHTLDAEGRVVSQKVGKGKSKANEEGIQGIMGYWSSLITPQVVQGNMKFDHYKLFIREISLNFLRILYVNRPEWGIEINQCREIYQTLINTAQLFLTRLIDNLERESYTHTLQHRESNTLMSAKKGLFGRVA